MINKNNGYVTQSSNWVDHTSEVILKIDKILSLAKSIDGNTKGYLLTGDTNYIIRFRNATADISSALVNVKMLTKDNFLQLQRIEEAKRLINEIISFRREVIMLRQNKGFDEANLFFRTGISAHSLVKLETHLALIEAEERQLLSTRKARNQSAINTYSFLIIILEAVIVCYLIIGFISIYLNINKRIKAEAELKRNSHFIKGLINNTTNPITIRDLNGIYLLANSSTLQIYNLKMEEVIGQSSYKLLPKKLAEEQRISDIEIIVTKKTVFKEYVYPHGGKERCYSSCSFPLYDEKEQFYAIGSFYTEITPIKEAKVLLEKSNHQMQSFINGLSTLLNTSLDVICVIDKDGRFRQISSNCEKLLGYTSDEIVGRQYIEFVHPEDIEKSNEIASQVMSGIVAIDFENRYRTKSNQWIDVQWVATWIDDDELMYCFAKDASKSKQTLEQLHKSEHSLRHAQKVAKLGNWEFNLQTGRLFCSEEFFHILGLLPGNKNFNFQSFLNIIHPDDLALLHKVSLEGGNNDSSWSIEIRVVKSINETITLNLVGQRFFDMDKLAYVKGTIRDITEQKVQQAEREAIISDLVKSNAELKQFSFITSHNLRAPLANILGISSLVDYETLSEQNKVLWNILFNAAKDLKTTIDDLTEVMVIKKNGTLRMETVDLPAVYNKVNNIFSNTLSEIKGTVTTDFNCSSVLFSTVYMESILLNLISNAIKYRSPNRSLHIKISTETAHAGQTIIKVSDNGLGINLNRYRDRIFGLYQRFHDHNDGRGVGLFIIKTQITALGADIGVESEEDKGTSFIIKFNNQRASAS